MALWTVTVYCPRCEARVRANVQGQYDIDRRLDEFEPKIEEQVALLSCPECKHPFLTTRTTEEVRHEEWKSSPWAVLYPGAGEELRGVPETIGRGYGEAVMCFHASAFTATAVMCRRTLEAMCKHKQASKRNLAANLKELQENGIIDSRLYEWADALRIVGNDAAHNVDEFMTKEDAKDGLDFTRAIIEYVYTFTDAFEKFKARREARKNGDSAKDGVAVGS